MGVANITGLDTIQGMHGYKVFECAINYMRVIGQNGFSLIIAVDIHNDHRFKFF